MQNKQKHAIPRASLQGGELFDIQNDKKEIKLLSVKEAAEKFPVSTSYLYKHAQYGIPAIKRGGKLMFEQNKLEEYLLSG